MFWDTSTDDFNVGLFFLAILKILKSLILMFITFENLLQNQCGGIGDDKYPLIKTVADIVNPCVECNFIKRQLEEVEVVRDFTEEELRLEEEGAKRASQIGNGRPVDVDPNA